MIRVAVDSGPIINQGPSVILLVLDGTPLPDLPLGRQVEVGAPALYSEPVAQPTPLEGSGLPGDLLAVVPRLIEGQLFNITTDPAAARINLVFHPDFSLVLPDMNYRNVEFVIGVLAASGRFEVLPA